LGKVSDDLANLSPYQCQALVREARASGETVERVIEHGRPTRRLRAVATPFADDDRTLLVIIDVTAQERAASIRRDFVANASHELKTPVTTIIASTDALRIAVERGDQSAVAFARQIEASARQLDGLVSDLLDLSRLEREAPDLSPVRLDLVAVDEAERIRPAAEEKGLDLSVETSGVLISASHRDVAIAVRNLLDNAIRYTASEGTVQIEVNPEGDEGVLKVTDTGEGIPSRDLERVFERFYRVDSGRARATGGTGLGLSIVKHVMDTHDGTVGVTSELGSGSVFTLRFPLLAEGSVSVSN
jgi:signal transduction histidine kinase